MLRILHDNWPTGLGENRYGQSSQAFDSYARADQQASVPWIVCAHAEGAQ